jgi:purine-binding chemotaxis protein CheW
MRMRQIDNNARSASSFMPKSVAAQELMAARAKHLAAKEVTADATQDQNLYISFELGQDQSYGIDFNQVKEVIHCGTITALPLAPDFVVGVVNYRGHLISIIDLRALFGFKKPTVIDTTHIIIVSIKQVTVGFLTSFIDNSRSYNSGSLEPALAINKKLKQIYVLGLHNGTTTILNVDEIVTDFKNELKGMVLGNQHS